MLKQEIAMF